MHTPNKPFFSRRVLDLSERVQSRVSHTAAGRAFVGIFTGSDSPAYVQLDWRSQGIEAVVPRAMEAPGNFTATKLVSGWRHATVFGAQVEEIKTRKEALAAEQPIEAVAYRSSDIWHVGTMATEEALFGELPNQQESGVAMRVGRNAMTASMGLYLPERRTFVGFETNHIVRPTTFVSAVPVHFPGIRLT